MTLQKFSANKSASHYDFKFSFRAIIIPGVLSFLFSLIVFPVSAFAENINIRTSVTQNDYNNIKESIHSLMSGFSSYQWMVCCFFAAMIGGLFALFSYRALLKRKMINFFLAAPIDRKTYFLNRVCSSVIMMGATIAAPLVIDLEFNAAAFGWSSYMAEYALGLFFNLFVVMLGGFAVMSLGVTVGYTLLDSLFAGIGLTALPYTISYARAAFKTAFLRGYSSSAEWLDEIAFSRPEVMPILFMFSKVDLDGYYYDYDNIFFKVNIGYIGDTYIHNISFSNISFEHLAFSDFRGAVVWTVISILLLCAAGFCLEKREVENTKIIRKSKISAFIVSAGSGLLAANIFASVSVSLRNYIQYNESKKALFAAITAAIFAVVFSAVYLVLCASIKKVRQWLLPTAAATVIPLAAIVILSTGGFGYSTYTPSADKIINVTVDTDCFSPKLCYAEPMDEAFTNIKYDTYFDAVESVGENYGYDSKESIESILKTIPLASKYAGQKGDCRTLEYTINLKNGKKIKRYYDNVTDEALKAVAELYCTNESAQNSFDDFFTESTYAAEDMEVTLILQNGSEEIKIDNTPALRKALKTDIKKIGYSRLFDANTDNTELCRICFGSEDMYTDISYDIYADMTAVTEYLDSINLTEKIKSNTLSKGAKGVALINVLDAKEYLPKDSYYALFQTISCARTAKIINEDEEENDYEDFDDFTEVLSLSGDYDEYSLVKSAKEYTDPDDIEYYASVSRQHFCYSDDDYILAVRYDDRYVFRIVPAKNVKMSKA